MTQESNASDFWSETGMGRVALVILAKAVTHAAWVPAFAGMTK